MRKHTPDASQSNPVTPLERLTYFVIGSLLGGGLGYGFLSAGPEPPPSLLEPHALALVFGLGAVCGALGALSPRTFWRRRRPFMEDRDDRDR